MCYDYDSLTADIDRLTDGYGFVGKTVIGKSVEGREIHCLTIGGGKRTTLIAASFHALETITAALAVKFAADYAAHIADGRTFFGKNAARLFVRNTLHIIPMVNPDGAEIAVHGINPLKHIHRELVDKVGICDFKNEWQANARGVDLNHNYDALWDAVKTAPAPSKYGGEYPESEPETRAVTAFVRRVRPDALIALHSQGGEIYCDFDGYIPDGAEKMAEEMACASGYTVCRPTGTAAFGGCKDWFISKFDRPGFTVEVGRGKNPLPLRTLDDIYAENARLLLCVMTE